MINNAEKLTAKWIPVTERLPKLEYNTFLFRGGIPEPTKLVYFSQKHQLFWDVLRNEVVELWPTDCWLEYNHSSFPERKW